MRRTGVFDSRFDMENLRMVSSAGGGTLLSAPSAEALDAAFARIDDLELVVRRSGSVMRKSSCRLPFMLTALGLLAGLRFIRRFFLGGFS
jgi:Ca-activated chloride channel family protein